MARGSRFKPTRAQRERVKLLKADGWSNERIAALIGVARNTLEAAFAAEIEFGADQKKAEVLEDLKAASKKGNASAARQLLDRFDTAKALRPEPTIAPKPPKLGKKQIEQQAAETPDLSTEMGELLARRMAPRLN